ncbi:MAG: hypothetical protein IJ565_03695 [Bacilli bacterium]|nr:hypothetical protein [Bacilli bacterium]
MNVIISNKSAELLQSLTIDVIKSEQGVFEVNEIISKYQNLFYQRMVLDITALKDYTDIKTLQKLSISLDMDKLILLLDDSPEVSSPEFLSQLISIGIYNFTKNVEGVMYLYNHPNTYRDVAQYHQIEHEDDGTGSGMGMTAYDSSHGVRIIGIKNVTKEAGATTLVYMMKKMLEKHYKVVAIEVDKSDFTYFRDKSLISTTSTNIGSVVAKNSNADIILIDMNSSSPAMSAVHDILYLIEPSIIRINKMMMVEPQILETLKGKHVVLNKSLLTAKDVLDFEYEARLKVFYNLPPLDDREKDIYILNSMLTKMGFTQQSDSEEAEKKKGILGLLGL